MKKANGNVETPAAVNDLPESRQAAWAQSMATYQESMDKLDNARDENARLKTEIAAYKVALDAKDALMADLESKVATMQLVRDEAVARRAQVETVLASMLALGRAFSIRSEPLITPAPDDVAAE